jgi:hypothetical protein
MTVLAEIAVNLMDYMPTVAADQLRRGSKPNVNTSLILLAWPFSNLSMACKLCWRDTQRVTSNQRCD